jgi:DHA2 family multidrug resistance protein
MNNNEPKVNPWMITLAVMLPAFMEVLDTTIANVSLTHIAGSLSVSTDEATWVLTSYLISNAIVIPCSAWLGQRFGRKNFLLACVVIFTVASFLCGLATSLPMLLAMRVLQGAGGGAFQPIAQSIMMESFPKEKQGMAMGIYGIGVVTAPILGPVLGGWITDNYSWRWIFFIKLPAGFLAYWLIQRFIHDPHWIRNAKPPRLDVIGAHQRPGSLFCGWRARARRQTDRPRCPRQAIRRQCRHDHPNPPFHRWLALRHRHGL